MIKPDRIANLIIEGLRPNNYDAHEEKKIKEWDKVKKGEIMEILIFPFKKEEQT